MSGEKGKLTPAAKRIVAAGKMLHGDRFHSAFAETVGVSKATIRHVDSGLRTPPAGLDEKVAGAIEKEAVRLRAVADKLDEMAAKMRGE